MAIFSIQAPDGKTYRVQGPNQAGAIEYLRSQLEGNQSTQPNYNPPGTGLGRAFKRGVNRTGQAFDLGKAAIAANTLRGMDVNKVETLDRALKLSMPPSTYEAVRKYAWDGLGSVKSEEDLDRWLNSLQQFGVGPQNIAKIQAMTKAAEEAKTDYRQEGGKFDQIEQSGIEALEAAQKKQQNIDALPMSPTAQTGAQDFQDAEGVLDWAKKSFKNPLGALAFIGEIAAESSPSIAAGIGTSILTGNPVAGAGVMIFSGAPQTFSGEFVDFLREKDIDLSNAEEIGEALRNDDILDEAFSRGIEAAAIIGFFEAIGMKAGGGILRQTFAQSATGGGGEAAKQYALDGKIVPKEVALEAVAETATVPGEVAIIQGRSLFTKDGNLVDPNSLNADQKQAAASVAQLLRQIANQNGYKLNDVNASSSQGAKQTLEAAHENISEQLKQIAGNKAVKGFLSPKNAKTLDQLIDDYSAAQVALRQGKNKVKSKVTKDNFDAIMRLLPDSAEKTQIANLLKMSNQVTDLFNNGLKGGLSQYTDYFNPLSVSGAAYDPRSGANVVLGGGAAIATFGKTLIIPAAGRIVDFFTGRRSNVARFVKKNENRLGLATPDGPSLIEQAEQKKATSKARRQAVAKIATILNAPKPGFVENILLGTGLDRNGLETVLNNMAADFASDPEFTSILNDIQSNLDAEGVEYLDVLTEIIPVIGAYAQANSPDLITNTPDNPLLKREFEGPNVDPTSPTQPQNQSDLDYGPTYTTQENYNRGIENNLQFNRELQEGATLDQSLSRGDRALIITSLENLTNNLGSSPVPTVQTEIQKLQDLGVSQEAIDTYVQPYVDRVISQQRRNAPKLEEARIVPVPFNNSRMQEIFGVSEPTQGGNYIDLDTKEDLTGNTYTGGKVSIVDGKPVLETQDTTSDPSTKADGRIVRVNLFKQKAGWKWVDNEDGPSTIVSTEVGNKHYYSLSSDFQTPVTLQTYPNKPSEPRLRPTTQGEVVLGNQVGSINLRGNIRPVYDEVRIVSKQQNNTGPILSQTPNPLNIPTEDLSATNLNEMPSAEDIAQMREGTYKPETKRTLVDAVDYLNKKWQKATGRTEPFEYTPENVDRIASLMATEAMQALKNDGNAIGWYDRKLKAAKSVVSLVDPRVTQSPDAEAAFDFALAVTSNGQAVADNFEYALEVFRHFMDNGVMPTDTWIKGGERNKAMIEAFTFFNTYNASATNMSIQDFLDSDFTVRDLKEWAAAFNARNGTKIKVPSSEGQNETVKGSYIIGPKIGQGFYQNIRGNYDPLTMDIWWMRMWNRLVGRPFKTQTAKAANEGRQRVKEALKTKNQDALEKRLTNESLKKLGLTRASLKDQDTFDEFVIELEANYQRFFSRRGKELKGTGKKVEKPELFLATGSLVKNITPQLQGQPKGPGERSYMRTVTKAAIEKLRQNGYMIDTADFQALMWYPEKQLFRKLGVAPGRGADNDYLDAAKMLAAKEGFTDDQINQALPPSDGDGAVNNQSNTPGQDGPGNPRASRVSPAQQPRVAAALAERIQGSDRRSTPRGAVPSQQEVKQAGQAIKAVLEIGKPGSRYEDGIRTLDDVRKLADVINISLELFSTQEALDAAYETAGGSGGKVAGFFQRNETTQRSRAAVLDEGAVDVLGVTTSEFDAYITALHEVLHGLADQQYHPGILNKFGTKAEGITRPLQKVGKNPLTGRIEIAGHGSWEQFVGRLLTNNTQTPKKLRNKVLKEIKDMQAKADFRPVGFSDTNNRSAVREREGIALDPNYKKYVRGAPEMAVDPLIFYMNNPKQMKKDYPATAKAIQGFFQYSTRVQFFTHPLAMAMAVIMAVMAKQDEAADEEERRRMMPPPGALNQPMQPGALSA